MRTDGKQEKNRGGAKKKKDGLRTTNGGGFDMVVPGLNYKDRETRGRSKIEVPWELERPGSHRKRKKEGTGGRSIGN